MAQEGHGGGDDSGDDRRFVGGGDSGDASSLKGGTLSPQLPPQSGGEMVRGAQQQGRKRKTGKISEANQPADKKGKSIKDAEYRERKKESHLKLEKEKNELESENQELKRKIEQLQSDKVTLEKKVLELGGEVTKIKLESEVIKTKLEGENQALRLEYALLKSENEKKDLQRNLEIAKQNQMAQPEQHPFYNIHMAQSGQHPFYNQVAQPGQLALHNQLAQPGQLPFHNQLPLPQPVQLHLHNQLPQHEQLPLNNLLPQHESASRISGSPPKLEQRWIPRTIQTEETFLNSNSSSTKLPQSSEPKLEQSAYCKELFRKYEKLDDRLKLCLLSFAVFPENAEVKKSLLRYWWVGEGTIAPDEAEEEFADETLKKFVEMEFIEAVNKKRRLSTSSYRMYPTVRSAVILWARKEQLFVYDHYRIPTMDFSKCYKACLVNAEEESEFIEVGKLETLLNVSEEFPDFKEEWFSKFKRIRVLSLQGRWESSTDRHLEVESTVCFEGFSEMKNLKFLSLQGMSRIKTLPNSLCKAAKLRILDLRACHNLEKLPDNIGSLKKLTHLDISECYMLDQMPKELSSLSELKVLKGFVISDHVKSCSLEELTALKKLEELSISIIDKEYKADRLGPAICEFKRLQKLKIAWGGAILTPAGEEEGEEEEESKELSSKEKPTDDLAKKQKRRKKESDAAQSTVANQGKQEDAKWNISDAVQSIVSTDKAENEIKLDTERGTKILGAEKRDRSKANTKSWGIELFKRSVNAVRATRLSTQKPWNVVKLELQCYPETTPPSWLAPEFLHRLEKLYIKGGRLHNLLNTGTKWTVRILRLKYLSHLKTDWKELRENFPKLEYLEKVRCPQL